MNPPCYIHTSCHTCRQVYTHRKAKSIEFMVADAMMEANTIYRFDEMLHDPELFLALNDSILTQVWTKGLRGYTDRIHL